MYFLIEPPRTSSQDYAMGLAKTATVEMFLFSLQPLTMSIESASFRSLDPFGEYIPSKDRRVLVVHAIQRQASTLMFLGRHSGPQDLRTTTGCKNYACYSEATMSEVTSLPLRSTKTVASSVRWKQSVASQCRSLDLPWQNLGQKTYVETRSH